MPAKTNRVSAFPANLPWAFWLCLALAALTGVWALYWLNETDDPEQSVFFVYVETPTGAATGSSFLVSGDNTVVTNFHVVEGADLLRIQYMEDGKLQSHAARLVWQDKTRDLAILTTRQPLPAKPLVIANVGAALPAKKEEVIAIGFPGLASSIAVTGRNTDARIRGELQREATISTGSVQRLVPSIDRLLIQHSADIHGGNSGGPLLDACNRVVGINTMGFRQQNLEFAVHSDELLNALRREKIEATTSSGSCALGMSASLRYSLAGLSIFSLLGFIFAGVAFRDQSRSTPGGEGGNIPPNHSSTTIMTDQFEDDDDEFHAALHPVGSGAPIELKFENDEGATCSIGRIEADNDLAINADAISRQHGVFQRHGGSATFEDLGSSNGTQINGKKLVPNRSYEIQNNDRIAFGDIEFFVRMESGETDPSPSTFPNDREEEWMLSGFDGNGKTIQQTIRKSQHIGREKDFTVGRAETNSFVIDDSSISRFHAKLAFDENGEFFLQDLGSTNGTSVDSHNVNNDRVPLSTAKSIAFGDVTLSLSRIS